MQPFYMGRVVTYSTNFSTSTKQIPFLGNLFLKIILGWQIPLPLLRSAVQLLLIHIGDKAQGVLVLHEMLAW